MADVVMGSRLSEDPAAQTSTEVKEPEIIGPVPTPASDKPSPDAQITTIKSNRPSPRSTPEWASRAMLALDYITRAVDEAGKTGDILARKVYDRLRIDDAIDLVLEDLDNYGKTPESEQLTPQMTVRLLDLEDRIDMFKAEMGPDINPLAIGGIMVGGLILLIGLSFIFSAASAAGTGAGTRIVSPKLKIERE